LDYRPFEVVPTDHAEQAPPVTHTAEAFQRLDDLHMVMLDDCGPQIAVVHRPDRRQFTAYDITLTGQRADRPAELPPHGLISSAGLRRGREVSHVYVGNLWPE
jgi:hypothetical protein